MTFDQFIERIAETIPTENSVVCIISNNAVFSQKTGVIYRDSQKNLTFFAMTAGRESVDGPWYAKYWEVEDWEDFIYRSMGSNANDIANVIISDYYRLNEQEKEKSLKEGNHILCPLKYKDITDKDDSSILCIYPENRNQRLEAQSGLFLMPKKLSETFENQLFDIVGDESKEWQEKNGV